jgi:23S rRNA pseudouridine2605 synthase
LDYNTEGLLFLTNDGEFCLRLTHPRFGVRKIYRVALEGRVGPEIAGRLVRGVEHDGERLRASKARLVSTSNSHSEIELELTEGRNREVRRIFEALGLNITQLRRTQIGRIKLGELPPGKWRVLTPPEVRSLILNAGDGPGVRIQGH